MLRGLADAGFEQPSEIQTLVIPPALEGPRHPRPGPHGNGQDGGVRRAALVQLRGGLCDAGADPGADPRAERAGGGGASHARQAHAAPQCRRLRRAADRVADEEAQNQPRDRRRHARPRDGPVRSSRAGLRQHPLRRRARRGRPNARHWFPRGHQANPERCEPRARQADSREGVPGREHPPRPPRRPGGGRRADARGHTIANDVRQRDARPRNRVPWRGGSCGRTTR